VGGVAVGGRVLAGVVFDDESGFHIDGVGYFGKQGCADEGALHAVEVYLDVVGYLSFL